MKLSFWDNTKPSGEITGTPLESVIDELCDRKQVLLLATPYLHFDSRFLERKGRELRLRATMSQDAAKHALGQGPVRLRFGWALTFYSGLTHVLGITQEDNSRFLRVSLPESLVLDEQRKDFRVENVGRIAGAIGSEDGTILRVTLENISSLGAAVFCVEPIPSGKFVAGHPLDLSLSLDASHVLRTHTRACHAHGQALGLVFQPPLGGGELERLRAWLAPREEEVRGRWENRTEYQARAEQAAKPKALPSGILFVSGNAELKQQLTAVLEDTLPVRFTAPALAPFKEAMATPPLLLLVDGTDSNLENRRRMRTILESTPMEAPIMVLGNDQDAEGGHLLAAELKNATYSTWHPQHAPFFRRLVQGLIRNHWKETPEGSTPP